MSRKDNNDSVKGRTFQNLIIDILRDQGLHEKINENSTGVARDYTLTQAEAEIMKELVEYFNRLKTLPNSPE